LITDYLLPASLLFEQPVQLFGSKNTNHDQVHGIKDGGLDCPSIMMGFG
jgi:hypothetical protein